MAFNDKVSYPWFAPAGFNRGALDFVTNAKVRLNSGDRDTLYSARINPIAVFPTGGYVIFGQKTLQLAKTALDRVNVRRLMIEVKRVVAGIANSILFEQNTPTTRAKFVSQVTPRLALIQAQAGIEKFRVVMDETNNTQVDVENNRVNGKIVVVPTKAVEFISIDFVITNAGVQFE
jgi:phage tail sheath protein FI